MDNPGFASLGTFPALQWKSLTNGKDGVIHQYTGGFAARSFQINFQCDPSIDLVIV
jgi:hypothetical protein